MARGTSLLALLHPIRIAVGGVTVAGSVILCYYQTKKQLNEAKERNRELHMLRSNIANNHLNYL